MLRLEWTIYFRDYVFMMLNLMKGSLNFFYFCIPSGIEIVEPSSYRLITETKKEVLIKSEKLNLRCDNASGKLFLQNTLSS